MESRWRFNVALFGMSLDNWRLCARGLLVPTNVLVNPANPIIPRARVFDVTDANQLPVFVGDFLIPPAFPHFPYGEQVEPD